jgi:hypothetical protein
MTFDVSAVGAFAYAEAGAWDWISNVQIDGNDVFYDGLFGSSVASSIDGYNWQGDSLSIEFFTPMPIGAFVTVPSPATAAEWLTSSINDVPSDFELVGTPMIGIYNDMVDLVTQTVTFTGAAGSSGNRYIHKLGVFSACSSLDHSTWVWTDMSDSCTDYGTYALC